MKWLFWLALAVAAWQAYSHLDETRRPTTPDVEASHYAKPPAPSARRVTRPARADFTCDGRQHCSQMKSLAEARYFTRHCPDTMMDGDRDGEPCENDSRWR